MVVNIIEVFKRYFTLKLEIHQALYGYIDTPAFQRAEKIVDQMKPVLKYIYKRNKRGLRWFT